jgi:DNA-binding GntR family transcriptional regulator
VKPDPHKTDSNSALEPAISANAPLESERLNNTHRAYREIRQRILDGAMPAGSQFLEQELAEMLGMSRTPVREALIRLQDERLVEVKPRHGARILGVTADELSDIYEITSDLEASALRRLARVGVKPAALQKIEQALAGMAQATAAGDFKEWLRWDNQFHETMVAEAGNQRLTDIFSGLMAQVYTARHGTMTGRTIPVVSNDEHTAIIAAVRAGDGELAHQLMLEHRLRSRAALVRYMKAGSRSG